MTAGGLVDARLAHGATNCPLNTAFVDVMALHGSGARISADPHGSKHVLPAPCGRCTRVLAIERVGQVDRAHPVQKVSLEHRAAARKMALERNVELLRKRHDTILATFCVAYQESCMPEVDVLHAQSYALRESQTGPVKKTSDKPVATGQPGKKTRNLLAIQYGRQLTWSLGPHDSGETPEWTINH